MSNLNTNQIELIKQQNRIKNAISGQNMFGVNAIGNSYRKGLRQLLNIYIQRTINSSVLKNFIADWKRMIPKENWHIYHSMMAGKVI